MIARFAEGVKLEARPLQDEAALALADLVARHKQLVEMRTAEKLRLQRAAQKRLKQSIVAVIETLDRELAKLDRDLGSLIEASPLWREKDELIQSAPGFGAKLSRVLIADLPELGQISGKEIAALVGPGAVHAAGRAPGAARARSAADGRGSAPRCSSRPWWRHRHDDEAKAFRQRLVDAGKPKIVALVALARKLLVRLNAMLRDNTPWAAA